MTSGNKDRALGFLKQVVAGDVQGAYDKYVGSGFRHHNPYYQGDRESLQKGMAEDEAQNPGKKIDVRLALEDGSHVAVHSRLEHPAVTTDISVVHIFRFDHGLIVEAWDIVQVTPEQIVNKNGMF
jgi:predicted SnoaL-like aldol condensation-catalyzing enzyme